PKGLVRHVHRMSARLLHDLQDVWKSEHGVNEKRWQKGYEDSYDRNRLGPPVPPGTGEHNKQNMGWKKEEIAEVELGQNAEQKTGEDQPLSAPISGSAQ